ncbi:putative mitochondrial carrier domain superfamily [Helianthus annuus]|nr:putative mitochondrial carrier domain superfamily [Helianthus annuus]
MSATYPMDLVRGRLTTDKSSSQYRGIAHALRTVLREEAEDAELSVTTKLVCGAAAGTVGQTVAYPLDVIRRRMQMVGWKHAASVVTADGKSALEYTGMVDAFRKTVRYEGFGALYKGLVPNSVKVNIRVFFSIFFCIFLVKCHFRP